MCYKEKKASIALYPKDVYINCNPPCKMDALGKQDVLSPRVYPGLKIKEYIIKIIDAWALHHSAFKSLDLNDLFLHVERYCNGTIVQNNHNSN